MAGETDNIGSADVISSAPLSAPVIVSQVIAALEEGKPDTVLEYEGVSPSVSSEVLLTLDTISDGSYEGSYRYLYIYLNYLKNLPCGFADVMLAVQPTIRILVA